MTMNYIAKRAAWKFFEGHGYRNHKGLVLHHKDVSMKTKDPDRYNEWRVKDLMPMTIEEHRRLHMKLEKPKGEFHLSKTHRKNIKNGLAASEHKKGKNYTLHLTKDDIEILAHSEADAARLIGCSIQLISQCLCSETYNKSAKGWTVELAA